ncbi:glycosyltransferase family 4 protein [Aurantimonas endophytica]|uniref:Glycosyltransferase involved in cell wall biosynthesis n=1 Tax=Aurantimonas endophytica TaxID=1522175 RepID=A0A7W6HGZ6_9HYPH|nr:glycosyltransferase family 4 protein [Aurantimonas endophytica]MBB4004831.1 glycosyltransferase involved in cell wall biosynthesis [Aurantimonas endophytica]MCO6405641.1 glycosyltransferase [Aurantimonas endophytica]
MRERVARNNADLVPRAARDSRAASIAKLELKAKPKIRVIHWVPYDAVGGVETAARSIGIGDFDTLQFHRGYIANKSRKVSGKFEHHGLFSSENNPINYIQAIIKTFNLRPDIIISSLWRSSIIALLAKVIRPETRVVAFIHSSSATHIIDRVLTNILMRYSVEIWVDSKSTLDNRVQKRQAYRSRIISFVLNDVKHPPRLSLTPSFIFWGRLHPHKGLNRALRLFASVHRRYPTASFTIIGPDAGAERNLRRLSRVLGVEERVQFKGTMSYDQIAAEAASHSFYLQTSEREGMAMSVVQAMQFGLVPVVTPVGEIANYCSEESSIIINNDEKACEEVLKALREPRTYYLRSTAAQNYWNNKPLYREDVISGCYEIMDKGNYK